ncbi:MAG: Mu-like prophage major head subunit gpT family protein [Roseitalea sp.]|nr:Mu-like prophage major head subunit gpT family protein [Roseitalea sp.]MBO6950989.1 Mu-like prophage major head subunit gpT family protein [Rhizobiaceae bacterium]MBO6591024.1 Mu-like prophage major head subunit gpT family protein [Roseitalea sp.]MBO6599718.1 Mu-like prophage major head subunit gpT family protein [Roseitalea sp.]MBO6611474.1 Mu-like prophage major head subunit gpT family protein [Roseitalea sp.]
MQVTGAAISALGVVLKADFQKGMAGVAPMWDKVATEIKSNARSNEYNWLDKWPRLREWIGERRIKELSGHSYTIRNRKWQSTVEVDLDDIEDDNAGMYSSLAEGEGQAAAKWPDQVVFGLLPKGFETVCYDGQNFFDTDHEVIDPETGEATSYANMQVGAGPAWYLMDTSQSLKPLIWQLRTKPVFANKSDPAKSDYVFMNDKALWGTKARGDAGFGFYEMAFGSKADLTEANFDAAYDAMTGQKDDEGNPLGVKPTILVVPPQLRKKGQEIVKATRKANGADNTNQGLVELVVCPYL